MSKEYYYYYFDEVNDDFANNGIETQKTPDDYEYLPDGAVYRLLGPLVYHLLVVNVSLGERLLARIPIKNKKVLRRRRDRSRGYFIYGNHTSAFTDAVSSPIAARTRQCYTVAHPDVISIKGIKTLVRMLGALPTPSTKNSFANFIDTINRLYEDGHPIVIYPEAHIWPKYNKIRNFPSSSFYYPVKLNAPCYVKTTVYRKRRNGHSKPVIYLDGPFYPDPALPYRKALEDLRDRVHAQMVRRVEENGSYLDCRYHYIKVDSADEVRTEVRTADERAADERADRDA